VFQKFVERGVKIGRGEGRQDKPDGEGKGDLYLNNYVRDLKGKGGGWGLS